MSPSRAYDALTILWTTADVIRRATLITIDRKIPATAYIQVSKTRPRETSPAQSSASTLNEATPKTVTRLVDRTPQREIVLREPFNIPPDTWSYVHSGASNDSTASGTPPASSTPKDAASVLSQSLENSYIFDGFQALSKGSQATIEDFDYQADAEPPTKLTPSRMPSSRLGRLFHYGSLGASLAAGTATEYVRRAATGSNGNSGSPVMSEANVARLVDKLSRMRGAALKLGQFLSIQDAHVLPEQIERLLRQVQNNAHYMPNAQLEYRQRSTTKSVLVAELGSDWRSKFADFDPIPIASASIGQVHKVTVSPSITSHPPSKPIPIALKVQFPNVAESISSDLANISTLLKASALLPRGLYLDRTLKVMRGELADECDYEREATALERFADFLGRKQERFKIPRVIREVTTKRVLAMEWMEGISVAKGAKWPKRIRDQIARDILTLCLRELFEFRFMQTDPNWSNFLYNPKTDQLELIDFGASREYSKGFMDNWYLLLNAAVQEDREKCIQYSLELGYLTGQENEEMLAAHVRSLTLLGIPFRSSTPQPFSFTSQTITDEIRALIPVMLRHRLTPPPQETYSLNRKLSGAFLLCGRLGADVDCRAIWEEVVGAYRLG
ncbi:ABC1 family protein [Ceratobasidium sp. AG-Ba]|nr:ABC1 family protein [Ceratobasidium sp. AG-Ba]